MCQRCCLIPKMKSNALSWNPMQASNFTVANEDHNLYTFDMRRLDHALMVHKDFVSAVYSSFLPISLEVWMWTTRQLGKSFVRDRTIDRFEFLGPTIPHVGKCIIVDECKGFRTLFQKLIASEFTRPNSQETPNLCFRDQTTPIFAFGKPKHPNRWAM